MKKYVFAVFLTFAFTSAFASCSAAESETVRLADSFTVTADICDCDFEAELTMERTPEAWYITVAAPETIAGMEIVLSENACRIEYDGLSYTVTDTDELPEYSPVRLTAAALDKCVRGKPAGTIGGEEYSFTLSDSIPASLSIGESYTAVFSDYKT